MDTRKVIHEGFLKKSPPQAKIEKGFKWHKRYFRLCSDKTLEYYKDKKEKKPLKEPIDLRNCQNVIPDPNEEEFKNSGVKFGEKWGWFFRLETPERTYHFVASAKNDMDEWIDKINKLNQNQFTEIDEIELPDRSNSLSSAVSTTSSSSNMSSPVMVRISPGRSRRTSNQSSSRSRASSAHSQEHHRVPARLNTTPASDMFPKPTVTEFSSRPLSPSPVVTADNSTIDAPYDTLDVINQNDHDDIYKVPINNAPSFSYSTLPNRPIPKPSISKPPPLPNPATKQPPTRTQQDFGAIGQGYELMDPKSPRSEKQELPDSYEPYELPYYPMKPKEPQIHTGPSPEKNFTPMPWVVRESKKSASLPRHNKSLTPDVPPKREDPTFSEIPNVTPKSPNDSEEPPPVQRETKPYVPPRVDRTKKPSATLPPRWRSQGGDNDGMLPPYENIDDENTNNEQLAYYKELHRSPRPFPYSDHELLNNHAPNNSPITHSSDGRKFTVGSQAHININVSPDITRPVPPAPHDNTPSSSSASPSPSRKISSASTSSKEVSYENDDAFEEGLKYENFVDRPPRSMTYSEVEGNRFSQSSEEAREREVEIKETSPGSQSSHYLIVDTDLSDAARDLGNEMRANGVRLNGY